MEISSIELPFYIQWLNFPKFANFDLRHTCTLILWLKTVHLNIDLLYLKIFLMVWFFTAFCLPRIFIRKLLLGILWMVFIAVVLFIIKLCWTSFIIRSNIGILFIYYRLFISFCTLLSWYLKLEEPVFVLISITSLTEK